MILWAIQVGTLEAIGVFGNPVPENLDDVSMTALDDSDADLEARAKVICTVTAPIEDEPWAGCCLRNFMKYPQRPILLIIMAAILGACASPPDNPDDICSIFEDRRSWYKAATKTEDRWGVPPYVSMSIIYQESSFQARAKPARRWLLGFIPWRRPSSAFGYAQVLDTTWDEYRQDAGGWGARRSRFKDAIDFVGWYSHNSYQRNGIARDDAYNLYLAYHEGNGGFARRTYVGKEWLLQASRQVQSRSDTFAYQYEGCKKELGRNWFMRLFF